MKEYIVIWTVPNIGECTYRTDDYEDAEGFYRKRVNEGYQPSIIMEEKIITKTKTKIK
jgi:hypothetical protein